MTGRILLCFSLYTNIGKVLSTKQAPGSIKCLHGIRFISMTWVILGHTYVCAEPHLDNSLQVSEALETFTIQAISNASVAVDSFFFLRLTPVYMFVLMLWMWVFPFMFSGPFWPQAPNGLNPNCEDNWWTNLLYINNVVNSDRGCMGWSWYLSNDMQFLVIGVPLVYILYRWQILGIAVQLVLLLASFITTAALSWQYDMKAPLGDIDKYYIKPYCRIGPYLVGVAVGWLLIKIKPKQIKNMCSENFLVLI
ncbi:nose resistant to fluoxetine protein 6-like [Branchiostoma floridae]|uniref:Nose resistant to fluoxetine protein 6-like n=1 Tax=Branchiostoma floridae TaxID=7739 RepID=A0A9J7HE72_BRAFL|nr:nose resistant to fluoxetine protein 6-like [Branchiostoma floridae]